MKQYIKPSFEVKSLMQDVTIADQFGNETPVSVPQDWKTSAFDNE